MFLNLVESKGTPDNDRYIRQSIIVYQEDLGEFLKELQKSLDFLKQNAKKTNRGSRLAAFFVFLEERLLFIALS